MSSNFYMHLILHTSVQVYFKLSMQVYFKLSMDLALVIFSYGLSLILRLLEHIEVPIVCTCL